WKIFRKTAESKPSYYFQQSPEAYARIAKTGKKTSLPRDTRSQAILWDHFQQVLMEDLAFVVLYIDANFEIRETIGPYEKFLALPRRQLHLNLLRMIPSN